MNEDVELIVAVDPGVSGGMAIGYAGDTPVLTKFSEPVVRKALQDMIFSGHDNIVAYMEEVHASPIMSKSSAFAFGNNFGWWRCELSHYSPEPYIPVTPQVWMKPYATDLIHLRRPGLKPDQVKRARKKYLLEEGRRLYPKIKGLTLATADALLIFHHGVQLHQTKTKGTR